MAAHRSLRILDAIVFLFDLTLWRLFWWAFILLVCSSDSTNSYFFCGGPLILTGPDAVAADAASRRSRDGHTAED